MNKKIILNSIDYQNSDLILELLNIANWLSSKNDIEHVVINMHPFHDKYMKIAFALRWLFLPGGVKKLKQYFISRYVNKIQNTDRRSKLSSSCTPLKHKIENIELGNRKIRIHFIQERLITGPIVFIENICIAIYLWARIYFRRDHSFLKIEYSSIRIGDLAASYAFRLDPGSQGSLKRASFLLLNLAYCIAIIRYSNKYSLSNNFKSYTFCPESTYVSGCYNRALGAMGSAIVDNRSPKYLYSIQDIDVYLSNESFKTSLKSLIDEQALNFDIDEYFYTRLHDPIKSLDYLEIGHNELHTSLLESQIQLQIEESNLTVIVFLQTISDGQYMFGINDAFTDIYDWTCFTIDYLCSEYKDITILIKPHPNIDDQLHPVDFGFVNELKKKYKAHNIHFLPKTFSPLKLKDFDNIVGVTIHGSVVEELLYLGIPVINSVYSLWGDCCEFTNPWRSINEYRKTLSDLNRIKNKKLTSYDYIRFKHWVYKYRYNALKISDTNILNKLFVYTENTNYYTSDYHERLRVVDELSHDQLVSFIEYCLSDTIRLSE